VGWDFSYLGKYVKIARIPHGRRNRMPAIVLLGAQRDDEGKIKTKALITGRI
jgi:hypothetical protein